MRLSSSRPMRLHAMWTGLLNRGRYLALTLLLGFATAGAVLAVDLLPPGHRPLPLGVHALVGGKVVVKPGTVIEGGTILIRDGLIVEVGNGIQPPADARVWDLKGATIYAGFIDSFLSFATSNAPVQTTKSEPIGAMSGVNFFGVKGDERDPGGSGPGYENARITPEYREARNFAPSVKTLEALREQGFTAGNVVPARGIIRGTSAFVLLGDANPNQSVLRPDVFQHIAFDPDGTREDGYPASLMGVISIIRQTFFDAQHYGLEQAEHAKHPEAGKRPEFNPALEALAPTLDKRMRVMFEPGSILMVDRATRVAQELGVDFALLSCGQEWRRPEMAKAAATTYIVPVNFPAAPKLPDDDDWLQISLDRLRAWDWAPENPAMLRQQGLDVALTTYGLADRKVFRKNLQMAVDRGLSEADALAALTTIPARLCGVSEQLGTIEKGKIANLTVVEGSYFDPQAKLLEVWVDGRAYPLQADPKVFKPVAEKKKSDATPTKGDDKKKSTEQREQAKKRLAHSTLEGRGPLASPKSILIRNAIVWTSGPQGTLTNASVLIHDGKIEQVGFFKVELGPDTLVIDAQGKHVSPGLIDCHSHTAILGGVNEGTIPSSAMCRISDVVNSETENLHHQLAGGLTAANLLHGSANPIGGQNCVIKLKDGAPPEELKIPDAIPGIKFALGENVKQSHSEKATTRFPQTRMGVPTFMANRFTAARQYLQEWETYRVKGGVPPRRDLELEAIGEILEGKRIIHCHSYRQDEILTFLRLMESFSVKVGTLQHILEGYKVADEIARHGAGASCFSDWWAYKFEVIDAIPYDGSLMRDRGVVVSFNSDSSELARRLYLEAAKAVKYGGTPEAEALKFVTLNPAKQLRIDAHVGSLEPGKDADFVIWSKPPTEAGTVCLETWIEGKKYFDRAQDAVHMQALEEERTALIAKAKKSPSAGGGEAGEGARAAFFQRVWEHMNDVSVDDCEDCHHDGRQQ